MSTLLDVYSTQFYEYVSDLPPPGRILVAIQQQLLSLFSENPDISKKKTGTTTCIQRDFPWIKVPELSSSRRIAQKTGGIHHSYRILKEGESNGGVR